MKKKTTIAVSWTAALEAVNRLSGIITFVILARLLEPSDFGLTAMALSAISVLEMMSAPGISRALIQHKSDIRPYLNAYWSFWIVRSFLISTVIFFLAPVASWFFKDPQAGELTRWLSPLVFLRGLVNPGTTLIFKDLTFDKKLMIDGSAQITQCVVTILVAKNYPSPMALVWGQIAREVAGTSISYMVLSYRPRWDSNWKPLKQFSGFSSWSWGVTINQFLIDMLDIFVVGRLLPSSAVGFYTKAKNLGFIIYGLSRQLFTKVLFPLYSMIQDEKERCGKLFINSVEYLFIIGIPAMILNFTVAKPLVGFVFGEKWLPMVEPLQILFVAGFLKTLQELITTFLQGIGRADTHFRITMAQLLPLIVLLPTLTPFYGLIGGAWAVMVSSAIAAFYAVIEVFRQHEYRLSDHTRDWKFPFTLPGKRS